ncbi:MAG: hypothetical protein M3335_08760 [Actinomycetota bacterium]|nr:hypothetical protein [Actinomycetota bacterium]
MVSPQIERALVRVLIGTALALAIWTCALVPIPQSAQGGPDLPALAFGQEGLYRLEVALLVFYGSLLLITPAFSGLARGRLPIEISARGAKFAEDADRSAELGEAAIERLEGEVGDLTEQMRQAKVEIDRLKEESDNCGAQ